MFNKRLEIFVLTFSKLNSSRLPLVNNAATLSPSVVTDDNHEDSGGGWCRTRLAAATDLLTVNLQTPIQPVSLLSPLLPPRALALNPSSSSHW